MSLDVVLTGSTSFSLRTLMRLTPSVSRIHSCRALNSPSSVMMIFFLLSVWGKCMYTWRRRVSPLTSLYRQAYAFVTDQKLVHQSVTLLICSMP